MLPCTLREWCIQAKRDASERPGQTCTDKARIKELERESKVLHTEYEIMKKASAQIGCVSCLLAKRRLRYKPSNRGGRPSDCFRCSIRRRAMTASGFPCLHRMTEDK